jgi:hypothetical protein
MQNYNPLSPLTNLIFLVITANPGGEGKTTIAKLMKALWKLFGSPVHVLDADPGNWSASVTDPEAIPVGWSVKTLMIPQILAATTGRNTILDLGGNALASAKEITDLLPALQRAYSANGYRTIALLPYSTNKPGATQSIRDVEENLIGFEKYYVKVDRDGSGHFYEDFNTDNTVTISHLQTAFQTLIMEQYKCFSNVITQPNENHSLARAYIAQWMKEFANQPIIKGIIGGEIATLRSINTPRANLSYAISKLANTSDDAIWENIRRSDILDAMECAGWTAAGLRSVADQIERGAI